MNRQHFAAAVASSIAVDADNNRARQVEPTQVVTPQAGGWSEAELAEALRNKESPSISAVEGLLCAHNHWRFHERRYVPARVEWWGAGKLSIDAKAASTSAAAAALQVERTHDFQIQLVCNSENCLWRRSADARSAQRVAHRGAATEEFAAVADYQAEIPSVVNVVAGVVTEAGKNEQHSEMSARRAEEAECVMPVMHVRMIPRHR